MGKNSNATRRLLFVITVLVLGLVVSLTSFAWYTAGNQKKAGLTVQAYDHYVYEITDIAGGVNTAALLTPSVAKADNQASGSSVFTTDTDGAVSGYNTIDGDISSASLKVDFKVENSSSPKIFKFQVNDVFAYTMATGAITEASDAALSTGSFKYDGTTYYYDNTRVYADQTRTTEITSTIGSNTSVPRYAYDPTLQKLYEVVTDDTFLLSMLKSQLIFQFTSGTGTDASRLGTLVTADDGTKSIGAERPNPTFAYWKQASTDADLAAIGYIQTQTSGNVTLNVAFNVLDDVLDRSLIGLKLKFDVSMSAVE